MPLLKSNKHATETAGNQPNMMAPSTNASGLPPQNDFNQNNVPGMQTGHNHHAGINNHQGGHVDPAVRPFGVHDTGAVNASGAVTQVDGATIPAAGAAKGGKGAGEKAFIGKLEHAAGTILCSSSLKAKGIQKEREAQAIKVQAAELSAAERLEEEAKMRRERAVAHGADPQILHQGPGGRQHQGQSPQQDNMSSAVESGAPNMAGVGTGNATSGVPQTNRLGGTNGFPQDGAPGGAPQMGNAGVSAMPHASHMQASGMQPEGQAYANQNHAHGFAGESAYPPMSNAGGVY